MGEAVVTGGDPAEVLEAAEHALDGIAVAIEVGREAVLPAPVGLGRDVRCDALALDLAAHGVTVVALVAVQNRRRRHLLEQGISGGAVGHVAAGQQEGERAAEAIGQRMDFRGPAAARATDGLRELPPLPPAAQR